MNHIYTAIMKAANQVESRFGSFDFYCTSTPRTCESSGCALGWIGHFLSLDECDIVYAALAIDTTETTFYHDMDKLSKYRVALRSSSLCKSPSSLRRSLRASDPRLRSRYLQGALMPSPFNSPLEPGAANYWVRDVSDDELAQHLRLMQELQRLEAAWVDPYSTDDGEVKDG